jgi:hypothetical protein
MHTSHRARAATALDLSKRPAALCSTANNRAEMARWVIFDHFRVMSALSQKADIARTLGDGRCVPLATKVQCSKSDLFDLLVDNGK